MNRGNQTPVLKRWLIYIYIQVYLHILNKDFIIHKIVNLYPIISRVNQLAILKGDSFWSIVNYI